MGVLPGSGKVEGRRWFNSRKSQLGRYWEDFLSSRRSSAGIAKISGACVYDPLAPAGHQWVVVSGETSPEVIGRWRARRQYIGQLEVLAAVATYYTLADGAPLPDGSRSHALRGRDVIHYVDNFGALLSVLG